MARSQRLDSLTSLRFFAAALVLLHHSALLIAPTGLLYAAVRTGYVGVEFFFVLSGFVLTWAHDERLPRRNFYGRRLARIYPMHLVTALVAVPVLLLVGDPPTAVPALLNVALLHAWVPIESVGSSLNGVSWSLSCEAFFYLCFPFIVRWALRRNLARAAAGVGIAIVVSTCVVALLLPADVAQLVLYKMPLFRIGEFALGVLVAVAVRRGHEIRLGVVPALFLLAGSYLVASIVMSVLSHTDFAQLRAYADLLMIPGTCVAIAAVAQSDLRSEPSPLRRRALVKLGEASFALYMVHYLLITVWTHFIHVSGAAAQVASIAVVSLLSVGLSLLAYRYVERPAERAIRRRIGAPADRVSVPPATTG